MGQTLKPLRIYVTDRSYLEWEQFKDLAAKGHLVRYVNLKSNTLLMGPGCHRLLPGMESYVDLCLTSARRTYVPTVKPKPSKKARRARKEVGG